MVHWNAQKDAVLLRGIFAFCDIKLSQPLLTFLANEIGEGCTAKAISHRLSIIRSVGTNNAVSPTTTSANSTPAKVSPGGGRGRGRARARGLGHGHGRKINIEDDINRDTTPTPIERKRGAGKMTPADDNIEEEKKRKIVKTEEEGSQEVPKFEALASEDEL